MKISRRSALILSGSALGLPMAGLTSVAAQERNADAAASAPLPASSFENPPREAILAIKANQETDLYDRPDGELRYILRHMHEFFPTARLTRSASSNPRAAVPLPASSFKEVTRMAAFRMPPTTWKSFTTMPQLPQLTAGHMSLDELLADQEIGFAGLLVLQGGRVVYESYPRMMPTDLHYMVSVSKVFAGALVAILAARGEIDVSKPIEAYVSDLVGSAWEGTPINDILDMASGMDAAEADLHENPASPFRAYEAANGFIRTDPPTTRTTYQVTRAFPRKEPPGQTLDYSSVNTFVLAWLAESVTGLPYDRILSREIWSRMGAEADGTFVVSRHGAPAASDGISMTLRDLARFGLLYTPRGRKNVGPVIPLEHVRTVQAGARGPLRAQNLDEWRFGTSGDPSLRGYRWQWDWVWDDGDFSVLGWRGQNLHVSPSRDLVVASFGVLGREGFSAALARQISLYLA